MHLRGVAAHGLRGPIELQGFPMGGDWSMPTDKRLAWHRYRQSVRQTPSKPLLLVKMGSGHAWARTEG